MRKITLKRDIVALAEVLPSLLCQLSMTGLAVSGDLRSHEITTDCKNDSFPQNYPQNVYVVVQFLSLVQFLFSFVIIIYKHKKEQRKIKIEPRIKLNYNIYNL